MKQRIENFEHEFVKIDLAEIKIDKCQVVSNNKARVTHTVSSVGVDGEGNEVILPQKTYKREFDYVGGNIFEEAMTAILDYLAV